MVGGGKFCWFGVKVGGVGGARAGDTSGWGVDCLNARPAAWSLDWWMGLVPMIAGMRNYHPMDLTGSGRADAPLRAAKTPPVHKMPPILSGLPPSHYIPLFIPRPV
jgi:hypothetical protein